MGIYLSSLITLRLNAASVTLLHGQRSRMLYAMSDSLHKTGRGTTLMIEYTVYIMQCICATNLFVKSNAQAKTQIINHKWNR